MAGRWIGAGCSWFCAALCLGIGLYAGKKKTPMHFWSGTEVPSWRVRDIPAYNRENRNMWCIYSIPYWLSGLLFFGSGTAAAGVMVAVGLLVFACTAGLAWLVWNYHRIEKKYLR